MSYYIIPLSLDIPTIYVFQILGPANIPGELEKHVATLGIERNPKTKAFQPK